MVNEQRGVLCRITATNSAAKPAKADVTLRVPGVLQPDGVGVSNGTQRKNFVSVLRPSRKPDSVTTEEGVVCWNWTLDLPAGGKAVLGYVAGDEKATASAPAASVETDARVAGWAAHFDATMDECQRVWEQRWADAFTPGNKHFSGSLPVLKTDHPALGAQLLHGRAHHADPGADAISRDAARLHHQRRAGRRHPVLLGRLDAGDRVGLAGTGGVEGDAPPLAGAKSPQRRAYLHGFGARLRRKAL